MSNVRERHWRPRLLKAAWRKRGVLWFCILFSIVIESDAFADASKRDVVFLARALSFLKSPDHENVKMVVAYDPVNAESAREATLFADSGKTGALSLGQIKVSIKLVPVQEVAAVESVDVLVITSGMRRHQLDLARTAELKGAFSISTDLSCVQDGNCVLGVQSQPSVKIVLNSKAASRAGIVFEPAFRMMVTEL